MEILIVLSFILIVSLPLFFVVGLLMMIAGKINQRKRTIRLGFVFFVGSTLIATSLLTYKYGLGNILPKLTPEDFIGRYELVDPENNPMQLQLYENGKFKMSDDVNFNLCSEGKYHVYDDEVWFRCENSARNAKIYRGIFGYELHFKTSEPKDETQFAFEKI